jgi:cytoskeletal protein CcmA (bactofilin family)
MSDNNLNVYGDGSYGGGSYDKININGEAVIAGDVDCNTIKIRGNGHIKGGIKSEKMSVLGHGSFEGTGDIYELSILGEAKIKGKTMITKAKILGQCDIDDNTVIDDNKVYGTLKIDGNYRGITAKIKGDLTVSGDAEVEQFISDGSFSIKGLLNGEEIIINPFISRSYAKEIGGERITVKKKKELSFSLPFTKSGGLEADVIEGNDIYLEDTTAKIVRGDNVEIGPNCKIEKVEYTGEYVVNGISQVGEVVKN